MTHRARQIINDDDDMSDLVPGRHGREKNYSVFGPLCRELLLRGDIYTTIFFSDAGCPFQLSHGITTCYSLALAIIRGHGRHAFPESAASPAPC